MPGDIDETFRRINAIIEHSADAIAFVGGVPEQWISKAEDALSLKFPDSLVRYLREYGGGSIGSEQINGIIGMEFSQACGPDIVYNTLFERNNYGIPMSYICLVSNEGDEMFYLNTSTTTTERENPVLRVLIQDVTRPQEYAPNFAEFLLKRIEFYLSSRVGWREV